ncbi:MAG: (d)CMP kinase [Nitrospirae bacterium]|nr:MAG: (d)CMP kinase [Nitrospirota bacterium]
MTTSEHRLIITIDGPAGSGKSTTAKLLAARLGYRYLDTGALYRAVAWKVRQSGIDPADRERIAQLVAEIDLHVRLKNSTMEVLVDGEEITARLREPEISRLASQVATIPAVRAKLLTLQRECGKQGGLIAEGRDMGTVVFPHADVKFFLDADASIRAMRRYHDQRAPEAGSGDIQTVQEHLVARDTQDQLRSIAPLRPAPDAVILDSTRLTAEQVVDRMLEYIPTHR